MVLPELNVRKRMEGQVGAEDDETALETESKEEKL